MLRVAHKLNPLAWEARSGRHRQLLPRHHHFDDRRARVREGRPQALLELTRALDAHAVQPDRAGHLREARVVEVGAEVDDADGLHLELDEGQAPRC